MLRVLNSYTEFGLLIIGLYNVVVWFSYGTNFEVVVISLLSVATYRILFPYVIILKEERPRR